MILGPFVDTSMQISGRRSQLKYTKVSKLPKQNALITQDKVRLLGGVHTVLNHCVVDQQNPYLPQWSIVALRMLMDNNLENQEIIRGLQSQNIVNSEDMKKLGIEVAKMDGDKPRVAVVHPES